MLRSFSVVMVVGSAYGPAEGYMQLSDSQVCLTVWTHAQ